MHSYRRLLAPLLMIVVLGQAVSASALPCAMMSDAAEGRSSDTQPVDHSMHNMDLAQVGETTATDCCASGGFCSAFSCMSTAALPSPGFAGHTTSPGALDSAPDDTVPRYCPETLLRPPIPA